MELKNTPENIGKFWDFTVKTTCGIAGGTSTYHTGSGMFWLSMLLLGVIIFLRRKYRTPKQLIITYVLLTSTLFLLLLVDYFLSQASPSPQFCI